jgi:Coenzyme PQQ synthesis protein D (PqqD)
MMKPASSAMPDFTLSTIVAASSEHVACQVEEEMVILSLATGEYYGLNGVSASVWALLQQPRSVQELRDALLEEFEGITAEECEEQLRVLLAEMAELKLITAG